jgi:ATP-binding cassette, subfamily B, bacterial
VLAAFERGSLVVRQAWRGFVDRLRDWLALFGLLWRAGRWLAVVVAGLALLLGLLPTAIIVLTGALVAAVPGAVAHGVGSPDGRLAFVWLAALVVAFVVSRLLTGLAGFLREVLDCRFGLTAHTAIAGAVLATPGIAPLEDPRIVDELAILEDGERRGFLRSTVNRLFTLVTTRLAGAGAFVVLLGFRWWAPIVLTAGWLVANRAYQRVTAGGLTVGMSEGAARLRRSEYLRTLAVEPAAAKEIRVFGLADWVVGRYAKAQADVLGTIWRNRRGNRWLTAGVVVAITVSHGVVLGVLAWSASRGQVGLGTVAVVGQAVLATSNLGTLGDLSWWLARSVALAGRITALQTMLDVTPHTGNRLATARRETGAVSVDLANVRFAYRGADRPVLDGLDLTIPAGQSLAIVGENGAGKSTLIKLLCGMYEPDTGRITVDGTTDLVAARPRLGGILQDFVHYELPLRDNIGFGGLACAGDQDALGSALRAAGGADLLAGLPDGWDTILAAGYQGGVDLSGGQWQRVALARALFAVGGGAGLLILDEPTAHLDVRAETELFERFLELTHNVTTILVSHRLSSVRRADRIVVIHGGRIVEDGSHEQLLSADGRYAHMFNLQAERFAVTGDVDGDASGAGRQVADSV